MTRSIISLSVMYACEEIGREARAAKARREALARMGVEK